MFKASPKAPPRKEVTEGIGKKKVRSKIVRGFGQNSLKKKYLFHQKSVFFQKLKRNPFLITVP